MRYCKTGLIYEGALGDWGASFFSPGRAHLLTTAARQWYSCIQQAERDVAEMLGDEVEAPSIRRQLRELSNK